MERDILTDLGQGRLSVSEDTIAMIAYVEGNGTPGIYEVSSDVSDELFEMLGPKHPRGVSVEVGQKECIISILVCIEYGIDIHKVIEDMRSRIAYRISELCEIITKEINVNVVDIKDVDQDEEYKRKEKQELSELNIPSLKVDGMMYVSEYVIAYISGTEARKVPGVASLSGSIAGEIADLFLKRNASKGVKVKVGRKETAIHLFLIAAYGTRIPDVAWEVQETVKEKVELFTGLRVIEVNITIQGIDFSGVGQGNEQNIDQRIK